VPLIHDAGGEVELVTEKDDCPQIVKLQGLPLPVQNLAEMAFRFDVESIYEAIAEIAHEQNFVIKPTK
jgi:hypothetical protein